MRRKENEAGSGLSCESDLPRSPARSHGPILREGAEPHAGDTAITGHKTLQELKRNTHLKAEDLAELLK